MKFRLFAIPFLVSVFSNATNAQGSGFSDFCNSEDLRPEQRVSVDWMVYKSGLSYDQATCERAEEILSQFAHLNLFRYMHEAYRPPLTDLSPIIFFPQILALTFSHERVENLGPVSKLKNLKYLNIGYNKVKSLESLRDLKFLKTLFINDNKISDLKPLEGLFDLEVLDISGNPISEIPLSVFNLTLPHLNSKGELIKLEIRNHPRDYSPN